MKKVILATAILSVLTLPGCAARPNPMTPNAENLITSFMAKSQKCFDAGKISPAEMASANMSKNYILTTWSSYNDQSLSEKYSNAYESVTADDLTCRNAQMEIIQNESIVNTRKGMISENKRINAENAREINRNIQESINNINANSRVQSTRCTNNFGTVNCTTY